MKRRAFMTLLGGTVAAWPHAARAQSNGRTRRIGVLWYAGGTDRQTQQRWLTAFQQGLEQLGWSESRDFHIDERFGSSDEVMQRAKELVALNPDVLVATSTPSLKALQQITTTVPIVFTQVTDPVGQGFVTSLARPGGNTTGFMNFESTMGGKWLEVLLEMSPDLAGVGVISNPANPQTEYFIPAIEAAAGGRSLQTRITRVRDDTELDQALAALGAERRFGMIVPPGPIKREFVEAMTRLRMPAIYWTRVFASEGGLLTYGTDETDLYRRAAGYVDRILKGATASDLPVQAPTKFELVINLKAAQALNLKVPQTLLARADDVIE